MKAITVWQPWATLIAAGAKTHEFRSWPVPRWVVGQRVAIHAGARKVRQAELNELRLALDGREWNGLDRERARPVLEAHPASFVLSAVVCTVVIGNPLSPHEVAQRNDSDRAAHFQWAWPLTDVERFDPPIPSRGAQGFWEWSEA